MRLQRVLDGENISYTAVDVWRHDDGAAFVRSVERREGDRTYGGARRNGAHESGPGHLVDLIRHGGTTG